MTGREGDQAGHQRTEAEREVFQWLGQAARREVRVTPQRPPASQQREDRKHPGCKGGLGVVGIWGQLQSGGSRWTLPQWGQLVSWSPDDP